MKIKTAIMILAAATFFIACGGDDGAAAGEACTTEADCQDGLHCHVEGGAGICEEEEGHSD